MFGADDAAFGLGTLPRAHFHGRVWCMCSLVFGRLAAGSQASQRSSTSRQAGSIWYESTDYYYTLLVALICYYGTIDVLLTPLIGSGAKRKVRQEETCRVVIFMLFGRVRNVTGRSLVWRLAPSRRGGPVGGGLPLHPPCGEC